MRNTRIGVLYRLESKLTPYTAAVRLAGGLPVPITPGEPVELSELNGLLLTGGTDVDPQLYGQSPHELTQAPDRERDEFELEALRGALERDLPVLAICRGMQLLNVALGGTLVQHIIEQGNIRHSVVSDPPGLPVHTVDFTATESKIRSIYGNIGHRVNSRHHQSVDKPAQGVRITSRSEDRIIESCELPGKRFVVAVQWHPEDMVQTSAADRRLFNTFIAHAED